jgi:hypothetical protein
MTRCCCQREEDQLNAGKGRKRKKHLVVETATLSTAGRTARTGVAVDLFTNEELIRSENRGEEKEGDVRSPRRRCKGRHSGWRCRRGAAQVEGMSVGEARKKGTRRACLPWRLSSSPQSVPPSTGSRVRIGSGGRRSDLTDRKKGMSLRRAETRGRKKKRDAPTR